ncbi:MAG: AraC family transcriptional regulator [Spirochaetota bacterium]
MKHEKHRDCLIPASFDELYGKYRVRVSTGAYCSFSERTTNSPHLHSAYHEICYVISGQGDYYYGNDHYPLQAGDVFIADPGIVHEITSHRTKDLYLVFFTFTVTPIEVAVSERFEDMLLDSFFAAHTIVIHGRDDIMRLLPAAGVSVRGGSGGQIQNTVIRTIVLALIDALTPSRVRPGNTQTDHAVQRAVDFISGNVRRHISVKEVALAAGTSERNLRYLFRRSLGKRVIDIINERKINHAAHLLCMHFKVYEIASAIGIDDPAQFTRLFKRTFGVSPKEYQRTNAPENSVRRTTFVASMGRRYA